MIAEESRTGISFSQQLRKLETETGFKFTDKEMDKLYRGGEIEKDVGEGEVLVNVIQIP